VKSGALLGFKPVGFKTVEFSRKMNECQAVGEGDGAVFLHKLWMNVHFQVHRGLQGDQFVKVVSHAAATEFELLEAADQYNHWVSAARTETGVLALVWSQSRRVVKVVGLHS
jgi:hypothetical protein